MPWSQKVIRSFQAIPQNPLEKEFYGPYNKLLHTLFPAGSDFMVVPQYMKAPNAGAADFIFMFEVQVERKTVFVLEIKPSSTDLVYAGRCPLPTLYGVCAVGTQLCFYALDTGDQNAYIMPLAIPRHPTRITDTVPASRWSHHVLDTGEAKLLAVVDEIKQGCSVL
ncbi:hypothetical protein BT96DRAFT_990279 [Gymnopus androsaceus JB14]|uniref:Type I restriction enzyme R protein N-terminal domain-containing protein n=1 Tax=Gymnopus androsaceus JB14 TaxID=1447944 RepID=A0A6A4I0B5_9AGAR|nr:hypothetical protein BT96DRAFT_990279 [Gymnopus androsaceus JB14]